MAVNKFIRIFCKMRFAFGNIKGKGTSFVRHTLQRYQSMMQVHRVLHNMQSNSCLRWHLRYIIPRYERFKSMFLQPFRNPCTCIRNGDPAITLPTFHQIRDRKQDTPSRRGILKRIWKKVLHGRSDLSLIYPIQELPFGQINIKLQTFDFGHLPERFRHIADQLQ